MRRGGADVRSRIRADFPFAAIEIMEALGHRWGPAAGDPGQIAGHGHGLG